MDCLNRRNPTIFSIFLVTFIGLSYSGLAQQSTSPADPGYYAMERQQMRFDDYQVLLINYRGFVCPRQYSMTGFTSVQFLPYTIQIKERNFTVYQDGKLIPDKPFGELVVITST